MGNYHSRKKTKAPKQGPKDNALDEEKAKKKKKPFFGYLKRKARPKIVVLLPLDKRNQLAEAGTPPDSGAGRSEDEAEETEAASSMRGAGDGTDCWEGPRAREMKKILIFLLQLDVGLQDEGWGSTKIAQIWQQLHAHLLAQNEAEGKVEDQPQHQKHQPWPGSHS